MTGTRIHSDTPNARVTEADREYLREAFPFPDDLSVGTFRDNPDTALEVRITDSDWDSWSQGDIINIKPHYSPVRSK